ncbi:MAG: helix-turn-helix domain-containing protein [Actinomycetota bacterium]
MIDYPLDDAPGLLRTAREDAGMTQVELARRAGTTQSVVSAIESGRRAPSAALLERLLRAAALRPSVPLERYSDAVVAAARSRRLDDVHVFGSVLTGSDDENSDVDLVVTPEPGTGLFALLAFAAEAERILGFPVDVLTDAEARAAGIDRESVPL